MFTPRGGCIKMPQLEFDPECVSKNELKKFDAKEWLEFQEYANAVVNPRKNIPQYYKGHVNYLNKHFNMTINVSTLADEQMFEIDQHLVETYFAQNPIADLLSRYGSSRAQRTPAWTAKHYGVTGEKFPAFTKGTSSGFRNAESFKLGVDPTEIDGIGAAVKIDLPWTLITEGREGVYDPEFWHNKMAIKKFGKFWDERLCLGTGGENTSGDTGVDGIHNFAALATFAGGAGSDNILSAAGDIDFTIVTMLADLEPFNAPGHNVIISTSGVATEILLHDSANTDRTEYERIKKKWFNSGIISEWVVDNNIEADTNANNTGRLQLLRVGPNTCMREIIYPFQKKPNMNKEFQDDIAFTFLTADIYKMYDTPVSTICAADQTTTSKGIIQNGVFMTGGLPPAQMPQAATAVRPTFFA